MKAQFTLFLNKYHNAASHSSDESLVLTCHVTYFSGDVYNKVYCILAHLWGAYAIPVALSGVRRLSYVVCRLCPA